MYLFYVCNIIQHDLSLDNQGNQGLEVSEVYFFLFLVYVIHMSLCKFPLFGTSKGLSYLISKSWCTNQSQISHSNQFIEM